MDSLVEEGVYDANFYLFNLILTIVSAWQMDCASFILRLLKNKFSTVFSMK